MKKLVLIIGGARSGKSSYAVNIAKKSKNKVIFIATCEPIDSEMRERIKLHQQARPKNWDLIEEGENIGDLLPMIKGAKKTILIDCLGLWISNLLRDPVKHNKIETEVKNLIKSINNVNFTVIMVSNDVGAGLIPCTSLGRKFRDLLGFTNQIIAKSSDEVIFMQAGIPIKIK